MDETPYHALSVIPDIDQKLLDGIGAGRSLLSLADQYNVSDVAVLHRLQKHPAYKQHQEIGIELRMDLREKELESANTNVSVTRADRLLGHARWLAERTAPARYGQVSKLTGADGSGPVQVQIVKFGQTIDGAAQQIPDIDDVSKR